MTRTAVRAGALVALLVVATGCGASSPGGPSASTGTNAVPGPTAPPPTFPTVSGAARIFSFDHELSYAVANYTQKSRFVLYDKGSFVLQYAMCNCGGEYRGRYTEANGVITFEWEAASPAGPWGATGTLRGDTLTVQYNSIMQLSDFEDAVYRQ